MKAMIKIPDKRYQRVKAECCLDGHSGWSAHWVRETAKLAEQISKQSADKRSCRDILKADRR
ncbi:MAG: hypothetical protein WCK89_00610 [bacterium]